MNNVLPFHDKDLALLPAPLVYENLDYEQLFAERSATFNAMHPLLFENGAPVYRQAELVQTATETYWKVPLNGDAGLYYLDLESDPSTRHIQADTYRELYLRQRINAAALATMPAYAKGSDLDHIGLRYFGLTRLTITPATNTTPAVMESDEGYLKRIILSPEGRAKGGSTGWYVFHGLSADGRIKDIRAVSPAPCHMTVTVLSHDGDGVASAELLEIVRVSVTGHYAFPQGDKVTVQTANVIHYDLSATVQLYPGPAAQPILAKIAAALTTYRQQSERIGHVIDEDGIYAALRQPGVYRASIQTPAALPLAVSAADAPYCNSIKVKEGTV